MLMIEIVDGGEKTPISRYSTSWLANTGRFLNGYNVPSLVTRTIPNQDSPNRIKLCESCACPDGQSKRTIRSVTSRH